MKRPRVLRSILLAACLALGPAAEEAASTPDESVGRGLAALGRMQQPDGSFGDSNAITALAGMAFIANGSTPTRGQYRDQVQRALRCLLAKQDGANGYLGRDYGTMYAHGFSTLFLAECYGMAPEQPVRSALVAAIDLIHRAQNAQGGWRYSFVPDSTADISITVCQVMALRAANNVGVGGSASQDAIGRAIAFVRRCANGDGSFSYLAREGEPGGRGTLNDIPRTAAGVMSLIGSGVNDPEDLQLGPGMRFLREHIAGFQDASPTFYWYGQYYAAQALFHSPDQDDWRRYWDLAQPALARRQGADGLWPGSGMEGSTAYATAMALIVLQIPNHYLPIFQR